MSSSENRFYNVREWWAATSTGGRVFIAGLLVVVAALLVWAMVPSAEQRRVDDCAKRMAAVSFSDKETHEETIQRSRDLCQTMSNQSDGQ
ncbi:hypothetical protein B7435_30425 [Mycolicibacterium peregrinum]|uniref:Uncharacterized protein n=1 Tax=Mycolicibacterium alvei TaxID=67081 RepID=A0A6N4V3Y5_9MYCO|nr:MULTISPECIES: hypothetical protein [Mycolicibacterium]MCV7003465.1 hypothetical protein [Mycolicibacterium alvei]OWL95599.1 hypothetical protein B7435_30425 [Mycolicibacterium peregrinum]BBX30587.1 hypothetical protein MALV_57120 [Mycolicibacterium alvei]